MSPRILRTTAPRYFGVKCARAGVFSNRGDTKGPFGIPAGTLAQVRCHNGPADSSAAFSRLPEGVGHVPVVDWLGWIHDHYGVGSQGLFKPILPPLGALFHPRVSISVCLLFERPVLVGIFSSRRCLPNHPCLRPSGPSERYRLVPAPSTFFPPPRDFFSVIIFCIPPS